MNYWQFKIPIKRWAQEGDEYDNLKENDIYTQTIQDKSNEPRDNVGDIIFVHNTVSESNKKYPNGIYFICEVMTTIVDYDSIDLKVIKSFKNNPMQLEDFGFSELKSFIDKKGMNGRLYKFTDEDNGKKLYDGLMSQEDTVSKLLKDIEDIQDEKDKSITETENFIKCRLGQGTFRRDLIEQWDGACSVTGYNKKDILVASHIKPWKDADNNERLDSYNGLLLIPTLDKLFDKGYISFDDSGKILISNELDNYEVLGVTKKLSIEVHSRHKKYLKYHRENVFQG